MAKAIDRGLENREIVLGVLTEVLDKGNFVHLVLNQALSKYQYLEKPDRAFITRVTEGTLEYLLQIDYIINSYSKTKTEKMKPLIRNILRMSVYQLLYMDRVPDSAVCNEAVKLAIHHHFQGLKGFVNGVLRTIARNKEDLDLSSPYLRYSLPQWMYSMWEKDWGKENAEKIAESFRIKGSGEDIKKMLASVEKRIAELGNVNPQGEAEYEEHMEKLAFYDKQLEDLRKSEEGLQKIVHEIDDAMTAQFKQAFAKINVEFGRIMKVMFRGGKGHLDLTDKVNPLNGGIELYLQLPGKKTQSLTLMSGGERALTVCALLLSFMAYSPAPFCFLDEIDAALDDANVERYGRMIEDYKKKTQFIIISHRKKTMEFADTLQGVTMAEKGVSSLITVRVSDYIKEE